MMSKTYTLRKASAADIAAVMQVERHSFEAGIAEDEAVFAERICCAPECCYVLIKPDGQSVCGYFTAEIWDSAKTEPESFSLGHSIRERHHPGGTVLYISSFALLPEVRGTRISELPAISALPVSDKKRKAAGTMGDTGIAEMFFTAVLEHITAACPQLNRIQLLVHEDWHKAIRIYERQGFARTQTLDRFAWFGNKRAFIYEKPIKTDTLSC